MGGGQCWQKISILVLVLALSFASHVTLGFFLLLSGSKCPSLYNLVFTKTPLRYMLLWKSVTSTADAPLLWKPLAPLSSSLQRWGGPGPFLLPFLCQIFSEAPCSYYTKLLCCPKPFRALSRLLLKLLQQPGVGNTLPVTRAPTPNRTGSSLAAGLSSVLDSAYQLFNTLPPILRGRTAYGKGRK